MEDYPDTTYDPYLEITYYTSTTTPTTREKITICHYPSGNSEKKHTIEISESALEAHLAHGDTEGACVED